MSQPLVIAYHIIWTAYGWWLPNDPRGSGSTVIRNDLLKALGELHHGRKRAQPCNAAIRAFYEKAESLLKHPRLTFDASAVDCIARAFASVIEEMKYTCYACAIMPDHVHLVLTPQSITLAQAVALGKHFSNHWMHHAFLDDLKGVKMSKSLGNVDNLLVGRSSAESQHSLKKWLEWKQRNHDALPPPDKAGGC